MRRRWMLVLAVLGSALVVVAHGGVASAGEGATAGRYRMVDLGTLGGATSQAYAMNDSGQVVGRSDTSDGAIHPFLWDRGRMTDLNLLGGYQATPGAINERGQIVGSSDVPGGGQHAVLWQDGRIIDLGTLGGPISAASDINDRGQILGWSTPAGSTAARNVIWQGTALTDLANRGVDADASLSALDNHGNLAGTRNCHAVVYRR